MRWATGLVISGLVACTSAAVEPAGETGGGASTQESTSYDPGSTTTSTTDHDESSSGGESYEPPPDEAFEWEPVSRFDCGARGHVIHESGPPANRVNFVILGDGYTADELESTYAQHVDALLQAMFGPDGFPYDEYASSINICRIDVVSAESGIDFPAQGIEVDTALDGQGDTATRLASVNPFKVDAEIADALAGTGVEADWVAVALNTGAWVGAGGYPMLWSGGHMYPEIGVHEAGHSFHALADEYGDDGTRVYEGGEPGEINVTANSRSDKWAVWLGFEQAELGTIDFYEGARYFDFDMWRPSYDGRMRTVTRPHNAPSIDKAIRDIYAIARPVDDFSPKIADAWPPALGLRLVDEARVVVDWEVDGELVLPDAGPRIWTSALGLAPGPHAVAAVVRDPTQWARAEDRTVLEMRVTWPVQVPADLEPTHDNGRSAPSTRVMRSLVVRPRAESISHRDERPHALDTATVRALAANATLLRAREHIERGRLAQARRELEHHAREYGALHARDRAQLEAASACLEQDARAAGLMLLAERPHGRFAKLLRRACSR